MKAFFSKSILLVFMFLGLSMVNLQAEEIKDVLADEITIELAVGFTIEDIIQDLQGKADITGISTYGMNQVHVIKFSPKQVDKSVLVNYLEGHKGVKKIILN